MNTLPDSVMLPARHLFEIPAERDVEVRVVAGTLWITIDGEPDDIVLDPGDTFTVPRRRRVLAYALQNARFTLAVASPQRPRVPVAGAAPWWRVLVPRTRGWGGAAHS